MRPDKHTIHDVFEKERPYVIPLYQRSYVWNQDEQWEPMWDDIRQQAERCLDDDSQRARTHFLGAIVWSNRPIVGRSVAKADVIDGQHRLPTIQICLAALRNYHQSRRDAFRASTGHLAKTRRGELKGYTG